MAKILIVHQRHISRFGLAYEKLNYVQYSYARQINKAPPSACSEFNLTWIIATTTKPFFTELGGVKLAISHVATQLPLCNHHSLWHNTHRDPLTGQCFPFGHQPAWLRSSKETMNVIWTSATLDQDPLKGPCLP
ncbi:hypothetical protein SK128_027362 [Halocaridina rubra]|uniref:Uncharacterized protein n=1 Tax=Halocaridina rubra TaxID=373956 RepID=A0AAN8X4V5_HALRR